MYASMLAIVMPKQPFATFNRAALDRMHWQPRFAPSRPFACYNTTLPCRWWVGIKQTEITIGAWQNTDFGCLQRALCVVIVDLIWWCCCLTRSMSSSQPGPEL